MLSNVKHGMARRGRRVPEYSNWAAMRSRCNNPNFWAYSHYGARGIKVCARWNDFTKFLEDMGRKPTPKHSIDRIDNEGNYEPSNCRWATSKEQRDNQRPRPTRGIRKLPSGNYQLRRYGHSVGVFSTYEEAVQHAF